MEEDRAVSTIVTGALVVRVDLESWTSVKRAVEDAGARIVFQKLAAPREWLEIVKLDAPPRPPREVRT